MASTRTKQPEPEAGPEVDGGQGAAAEEPTPETASGPVVMEYLGGDVHAYLFAGAPPQTAGPGDVCELPHDPGDGHWAPTKRKVSRLHDTHPDEIAKRSRRQAEQRAKAHGQISTEQAADAAGEA